jgi:hypothetical protein
MQSATSKIELERAELDSVLASGILGRTNNLVRMLTFVCEKYFEGETDEIKEYIIAVHALGRPENFDPQVDTIVRVTAHALRKRLEDYYRTVEPEHPVRICLPAGHYVPKFIHKHEEDTEELQLSLEESHKGQPTIGQGIAGDASSKLEEEVESPIAAGSTRETDFNRREQGRHIGKRKLLKVAELVSAGVIIVAVLSVLVWRRLNPTTRREVASPTLAAAAPISTSSGAIRALAASGVEAYTDRAGFTWASDQYCSGGSSFSVTGHTIQGTEDQQLYSSGRRGIFHCQYPVPPGVYEVHLSFEETSDIQENSRNVVFSIADGPAQSLDVVDDAGGDDIATTKIYTDVSPSKDGRIHIDFNTAESFVNAIEILPSTPDHMRPVRILAGPTAYRDAQGNEWLPDRYFFGGRLSLFGGNLSTLPNGGMYEGHRFGHFHYIIPVARDEKYTLKLHFLEHWFGSQNGGIGGVGSRVFDVSCNGSILLKNFDIYKEAGAAPLVKTFSHIEPTAQGKIELYFTPVVNYPSISAIEVLPE